MDDGSSTSSVGLSRNIILLAIILALLIIGVSVYMVIGKKTQEQVMKTAVKPSLTPTPAIRSLKDLLTSAASMQCDFTENGTHTSLYIKAGAVRADMTLTAASPSPKAQMESQKGSFILKDGIMYFWNGKKGIKRAFDVNQMMKEASTIPKASDSAGTSEQINGNSMIAAFERYRQNCKPAVVADALFVPPTGVTFQDLSKMMPSGTVRPSGAQVAPSGMSPEQFQQLQKQYQQKSQGE